MRMRIGALVWLSVVVSLAAVHSASAIGPYCGCANYSASPSCDAQSCFPACQQQSRVRYQLVWENVQEKRWHTCYKTVQKIVDKQVCKTVWKTETQTVQCPQEKIVYNDVPKEILERVSKTVLQDETFTVYKQVQDIQWKEVRCQTCRKVPVVEYRDCVEVINKPVYANETRTHQIQKQVCEQQMRECVVQCTKPVSETQYKTICCQVCKCVNETQVKNCCTTVCRDVPETCYKECVQKICKPVTTLKCVKRLVRECVDETYCVPGRTYTEWVDQCCTDCCFDPCSLTAPVSVRKVRVTHQCPPQICTRKVWKIRWVTEQVPCTTNEYECIRTKVPYIVHRQVRENVVSQVPYVVPRMVRGAYVDEKGNASEISGPGLKFQENAVARKQVPYQVTRMVTEIQKRQVPFTVTRCVTGAYVDEKGIGYDTEGPGRKFDEKGVIKTQHQTCTYVQEQKVTKVPYTVCKNVIEEQVRKVPHCVCKMVPETCTRKVPHTICEVQKRVVTEKVATRVCEMKPVTVTVQRPTTVIEKVSCPVNETVKVCVPEIKWVKKLRRVAVAESPCSMPCQPSLLNPCNSCPPASISCQQPCLNNTCSSSVCPSCQIGTICDKCQTCTKATCQTCSCREDSCCLLSRFRRWVRSSSSCETTTCKTESTPCPTTCTTCNDSCDPCRENLLQRLFRSRFCCTNPCSDPCSQVVPTAVVPSVKN